MCLYFCVFVFYRGSNGSCVLIQHRVRHASIPKQRKHAPPLPTTAQRGAIRVGSPVEYPMLAKVITKTRTVPGTQWVETILFCVQIV